MVSTWLHRVFNMLLYSNYHACQTVSMNANAVKVSFSFHTHIILLALILLFKSNELCGGIVTFLASFSFL